MTQSRSSIILALTILMIVVVESYTQNIEQNHNIVDTGKDGNQTEYDVDIQMNFIDSELKEDGSDSQEIPPEEPIVIDLGHEFNNKTIPTDKENATILGENVETNFKNGFPSDKFSTTEVQQSQVRVNETNKTIDNLREAEAGLLETTIAPIPDETISTLAPTNENISSSIDNTLSTVDPSQVETQTQSIEILHETSTSYNSKAPHDLSIYFENEPSQARQLRDFNKETDNEIISHTELESDPISNINSEISHLSGREENKAAKDSPLSENLSNATAFEPKNESLANIAIENPAKSVTEDLVEEIEAVTESIGEITNDVTVVANEETHTIMKKPGVVEESPKNTTVGLIQEQTNEIGAARSDSELDPVVNLVLNRPKEALETFATTILSAGNHSLGNDTQLDEVVAPLTVTEKIIYDEAQIPKIDETSETKSLLESKILDKSKEIEEDSNSVDLNINTPSEHQENKLGISEQKSLSEVVKSFKPNPENASSPQKNEPNSGLNVINDDKNLEANLLIDDIVTSTQAPSHGTNEQSFFENTQEAQSSKGENGIFKDIKEDPLNSTEEPIPNIILHENVVETSTEMPTKVLLEENQSGTIADNVSLETTTDETLPVTFNDKTSNGLKEEPFSGLNFIPDDIEVSTQYPSANRHEQELVGEVQEDQTSKTDIGIFKKTDETLLNPIDESLPDPKHYEQPVETSTEKPTIYKIDEQTSHLGTTDYARHVDSLQTMRDESSSVVSDEVIAPASVGRSLNEVIAEGLGKPLPTRSVGDAPSSSSYSSEDKTTTVLVLCAAAGGIFIAFSFAIYLISFQRQHGTLDIEMQEQQCGKDNLDDDDDSETRVSLLNQIPTVDSDEHSSD